MNCAESVPEIIKDIDCIQETQQHSVSVEHNWTISDICDLIEQKSPGEKIESEQFGYTNSTTASSEDYNSRTSEPTFSGAFISTNSTSLTPQEDLLYDYFLSKSLWRMEINKSESDPSFISLNLQLIHSINEPVKSTYLSSFRQHATKPLILKIHFYLFNKNLTELFVCESLEVNFDLRKFFVSLFDTDNRTGCGDVIRTKLVEKFNVDKFCRTREMLMWLDEQKSEDFCVLTQLRVYNQWEEDITGDLSRISKGRFTVGQNRSKTPPIGIDHLNGRTRMNLILSYKHAWTIRKWRDFLMPANSTTHTFMNDTEINQIFSNSQLKSTNPVIQFTKFRSKLFSLIDTYDQPNTEHQSAHNPYEKLLNEVKWKLQLYPNGYNREFANNLSLFVNFSQLDGELAQFSQPATKKKSHLNLTNLRANNVKVIEETFYDRNPQSGMILLIKSPGSEKLNEAILDGDFSRLDEVQPGVDQTNLDQKKRNKKLANLYETFVKASFQISILDSKGNRVDKCQSEKQLFELHGSWGYKEYMTIKDMNDASDKYLNDKSLRLNCKIVLFYTATSKSRPTCQNTEMFTEKLEVSSLSSDSIGNVDSDLVSTENSQESNDFCVAKISTKSKKRTRRLGVKSMGDKTPVRECNSLLYDLRRTLKQSEMSDLIVRVPIADVENHVDPVDEKFKEFKVHKLILSIRSEVFEKMFNHTDQEGSLLCPLILDIVDFDVFTVQLFLNYLYTDQIEIHELEPSHISPGNDSNKANEFNTHIFIELYKIADKYCVHRLKRICEEELLSLINISNTIELLILSYLHDSNRLKRRCFKSLSENVSAILAQAEWLHLERNYPTLLAEAFRVLYVQKQT